MRTIAPDTFADDFFGQRMDYFQRLLWLGLILRCADDQGRLKDNPARIRIDVFPYDEIKNQDIETALAQFEHAGKIIRYSSGLNGSRTDLIQVSNWWKYQRSASWMAASQYPAPDGWIDRYRFHAKRNEIKEANWDKPGGFLPSNYIDATLPLPSTLPSREVEVEVEVEDEDEDEVEVEVERMGDPPRQTNTIPPPDLAAGSPALPTATTHIQSGKRKAGQPVKIGSIVSEVIKEGKPCSVSGYTQFTPSEIIDSNLNAGVPNTELIYQQVTTLATFPSNIRADAQRIIAAICQDRHLDHAGAVAHLKPYFEQYIQRKNKSGHTYARTGIGWLEWALGGSIPATGPAARKKENIDFVCKPDCPVCKGTAKVSGGPCPNSTGIIQKG
jgi:hypothetical protein